MDVFELTLGIEARQHLDLGILRMGGNHCEGRKNVEKMVRKYEELNARAKKLLEKAHASYEKQSNETQRHIKFNISDLVWLNIWNFLNA